MVAVDVGTVRVGVAASDPTGLLASPVATLPRDVVAAAAGTAGTDVEAVAALVGERAAVRVVVGLPRHLRGGEGPSAQDARTWAGLLRERVAPVPVDLVDERLTTVVAERGLSAAGVRGPARRRVVDQAAAVVILEGVLLAYRAGTAGTSAPVALPHADLPHADLPLPPAPARRPRRRTRRT